jgi:L-seryl-tRNA(Ser) seleniumtransferase
MKDKVVIITGGQLVEIGGGFRVPDIMVQSGGHLVEVGTTNRTYLRDYEQAITSGSTGMLLSVHYSNYQITGFTTQPSLTELAELAQRYDLPFVEDLGSGTLLDTTPFGLQHEPTIQESIAAGVDLVTASGDKLLGGPQAGLIFGKAYLVDKLKRHPLIRALRVDKTTLAALHATLLAYLENSALAEIPVWQMISAAPEVLAQRAQKWCAGLGAIDGVTAQVVETVSTVGGGSLPGQTLPSKALALTVNSADALAARLRETDTAGLVPPIIARIEDGRVLLDPRTVLPEQDALVIAGLARVLG